jgi:hypothetical protein
VAAPSNEATIREELRRMFADERPVVADARSRSADSAPPSPEEGALLAWLAGRLPLTSGPSDVVEIGAAGGVAALHMIPALPPTATLTMIEPDTNAHALASEAIEVAGHTDRVRAILDACEIPRERYELVFPIEHLTRAQMAEDMPPDLLALCSCCRKPIAGRNCGRCITCNELREAGIIYKVNPPK